MLERLLNIIAPDECLVCGKEGLCLCPKCALSTLVAKKPACVVCNRLNNTGKTCSGCYNKTKLSGASISYRFEGQTKELIYAMKYLGKRSVARYLAGQLPAIKNSADMILSYVPSDGKTRRQRGYDQAELLARSYAKLNGLQFATVLTRACHTKQVGLSRARRLQNIQGNFVCYKDVAGKSIVLIDDVITTAATVSECSKTLKESGAKRIWALAIAKG